MIMYRHRRTGLTLVEMLVVLALVLFILALFSSLMVQATEAMSTMKGITSIDQKMRNVATALRHDLHHLYLANGGTKLSPSELFTSASAIPDRGYLTIAENARAARQGIDAFNQPSEVDNDDVLAMTVQLSGTTSSEMHYGRTTHTTTATGDGFVLVNGLPVIGDIGEYLDDIFEEPFTRFDRPGNGIYSSRSAEVIYFLRPVNSQYEGRDLRSDVNTGIVPPVPALFNLHRRQLLVIESAAQLNRPSPLTPDDDNDGVPDGIAFPMNGGNELPFYNLFDISACREFEVTNTLPTPNWFFGNQFRIHFNSLEDLAKPEYRFGRRLFMFDNPAHPQGMMNTAGQNPNAPYRVFRSIPISSADPAGNMQLLHDYHFAGNVQNNWFGAPTMAETNHTNYPFWRDTTPGAGNPPPQSVSQLDTNRNGKIDDYDGLVGQRAGEEIILTNVVSFDIKVLEDYGGLAAAVNPLRDFTLGQNMNMTGRNRRPQFVDLGYYADSTSPETYPAFRAGADSNINVVVLLNNDTGGATPNFYHYIRHPQYAPFGVLLTDQLRSRGGTTADTAGYDAFVLQLCYGPDGQPGEAGVDDNMNGTIDDAAEYNPAAPVADDYADAAIRAFLDRLKGPDGEWGRAGVDDNGVDGTDQFDTGEYLAPGSDDLPAAIHALAGQDGGWGVAGTDDDGNGVVDDITEYLWAGSDDVPFNVTNPATATGVLFGRSGQVATPTGLGAVGMMNLGNTAGLNYGFNPRNVYDSWSSSFEFRPPFENAAGTVVMPADAQDGFRPVPYPRPLKAIQITLRVLEPRSSIVRELTFRHYFE